MIRLWRIFIFQNVIPAFYVTIEVNFAFRNHYPMKLKSFHSKLSCAVFAILLLAFNANAQENRGNYDQEGTKDNNNDANTAGEMLDSRLNRGFSSNPAQPQSETVILRDAEIKNAKPAAQPAKPAKEDPKTMKKEGDPLSFNFLYYFIEKFKLSDLLE